jgi:phosphate starvation-inducible PhoH-like protein
MRFRAQNGQAHHPHPAAVEAGERLGFLPGDLQQKGRPLPAPAVRRALRHDGPDDLRNAFERGTIEVAPLAFMRGRTLNDAFIILDEAQNTTPEQMKMFLTRIGFGSKMVITGDITQIDLPWPKSSSSPCWPRCWPSACRRRRPPCSA